MRGMWRNAERAGAVVRIGVTGGRNYTDKVRVAETLGRIIEIMAIETFGRPELLLPLTLVYGCATGADTLASAFAISRDWKLDPFPADWPNCGALCPMDGGRHRRKRRDGSRYCPIAGHLRNQAMVDSGLDVLVAFPGGTGTADMTRRARKAGVRIVEVP